MKRNVFETITGAVVLLIAAAFIAYAFSQTGIASVRGYQVTAEFDDTTGLTSGSDVRMSGVRIGTVVQNRLNPDTYFAEVVMTIDDSVRLPADTSARIVPESLLGGNYLALEPGGDDEMIESGGRIIYTQGAVNLMDLIGRFMFSNGDGGGGGSGGGMGGMPQ